MNVVVLAAHGLNCHWLGPYGNEWVQTPSLDALACESIVFDQHFADDPSPEGFGRLFPAEFITGLHDGGVRTVLLDDRRNRSPDERPWGRMIRTEPARHPTPGDALVATAEQALSELKTPWLLWIETDRLLPPWDFEFETYQQYAEASGGFIEDRPVENEEPIDDPPQGHIEIDESLWHRLHNSFAAAVTSFDAEVGRLVAAIRSQGLDKTTTLMLTSGYGWPLGEHGVVGCVGSRMHEELVHLPLIVRMPGGREALRRVSALTQTPDLASTVLDLAGITPPTPSLMGLTSGKATFRDVCRYSTGTESGLRTIEWSFFPATAKQPPRLYRKPDDIWEVNDLAARHADECDRLTELLNQEATP
jgi:arylsulfatase A-like enzyme